MASSLWTPACPTRLTPDPGCSHSRNLFCITATMSRVTADTVVYLISGANRGLGFGLVQTLAARSNVLIFAGARDPAKAEQLQALAETHSNVRVVQLNACSDDDARSAVAAISQAADRVDVLIANAGVSGYFGRVDETELDKLRERLEVNTLGPLHLYQAVYRLLLRSSAAKVVTISSGAGSIAMQSELRLTNAAYGASKAALNYITRKIHFENDTITAFPMQPGWVQTDLGNYSARLNGAKDAPVTVHDSVTGMLRVIDTATKETHSGRFWTYEGTEIPW